MTTKSFQWGLVPFLVQRSEPLPKNTPVALRYDQTRQVALVKQADQWLDALDVRAPEVGTRITRIEKETTDDE